MMSPNHKRLLGRAAAALLLAGGAASAAANVLVVRSSGPSAASYPPGKSLPDNGPIVLRNGDSVTVLDARGTRTFRDAGTYNPSVAPRAGAAASVAASRPRVGAVRAAGFVPGVEANIWQVDVAQGGTHCLTDAQAPVLWRADTSRPAHATISGPDGATREVAWAEGEELAAWPEDLTVADGVEYGLSQAGVAVPARITFRRLGSTPRDSQSVAAALIEAGCQEQLDLLVDSIAGP